MCSRNTCSEYYIMKVANYMFDLFQVFGLLISIFKVIFTCTRPSMCKKCNTYNIWQSIQFGIIFALLNSVTLKDSYYFFLISIDIEKYCTNCVLD